MKKYLTSCLVCAALCATVLGCAAIADLVGAAADPTSPAGAVVTVASSWLPWLPWAVAGVNALLGVWVAVRGRRAKSAAVALAQAIETADAVPVKQIVAASTRNTSVGAWIDHMIESYVSEKP